MASKERKYSRRRLRSSYISTVVSISLVLFVLGLLGMILLSANRISEHVKENIGFSIILKPNLKQVDITHIRKSLDAKKYVKETTFMDPDSEAKILKKDLGEDFVHFLGYNPLLPTIQLKLNPDYVNPDSLSIIEKRLSQNSNIKEVYYQKDLVSLVNENLKKISIVMLVFSILLLIVSIALINSSIRLAIYSKRFLIKTMQLVGATHRFIRKPFVANSILNGIISAIIALGLLTGVLYLAERELPDLVKIQDMRLYISLFAGVLILGIFISWISTTLAIRKYLRIQADRLYG